MVKELRKSTGLSQVAFAKKYGIPLRTLQSWEIGERKPAPYIVAMISKLVEYERLIGGLTNES